MDEVDLEDDEDIIEDMEMMDPLQSGSSSDFSSQGINGLRKRRGKYDV